jgi:NADPH:quinone reductase-like Zn-dependent oxidoreductase
MRQITRTFPFDEAAAASSFHSGPQNIGKVVLTP